MLKWKNKPIIQTRDLNTEITPAIKATIQGMFTSSSVPPRKRTESSTPIVRALEKIFDDTEYKKRLP